MVKLPRTIRMDPSDTFVFDNAAEPGEWAVAGTFLFHGRRVDDLPRKQRNAFRSGFAGIESFGFSTLAVVAEATAEEEDAAIEQLAARLVDRLGAPDRETARPAAREEIAFAAELCRDHAVGTLLALHRTEEDGQVRERFRTLRQRADTPFADPSMRGHGKAFFIVETDEEDEPEEHLDLASLGSRR
ncbi:DUF6505 family protein [Pararhizobium haloflavum]|uniref:DUF6505 family protein n=1 Tax=Pararhizobium haloflavum TaxID=2037914 RepID=UPI000C19B088|nr:DUF6505 family protein [Pararhizobium haloflavum]